MVIRTVRAVIAKVIIERFETTYKDHGVSYDPDTCYEAADDIVSVLRDMFVISLGGEAPCE